LLNGISQQENGDAVVADAVAVAIIIGLVLVFVMAFSKMPVVDFQEFEDCRNIRDKR
jgi:hypothetical protein